MNKLNKSILEIKYIIIHKYLSKNKFKSFILALYILIHSSMLKFYICIYL